MAGVSVVRLSSLECGGNLLLELGPVFAGEAFSSLPGVDEFAVTLSFGRVEEDRNFKPPSLSLISHQFELEEVGVLLGQPGLGLVGL